MADMDVTARFRADTTDFTNKVKKMNDLYQDSAGKWRDASGKFATAAQQAAAGVGGMGDSAKKASGGFTVLKGAIATAAGAAVVGGIYAAGRAMTDFAAGSLAAADEAFKATARLDQIASSIGALDTVLGGSTQRLQDFASDLSMMIGVEDEAIMSSQALLMTFSNVAATSGDLGGIFDRATTAAADLAAAGFGSLDSNAKMLGKALQNPVRGMTALTRAGVTFSDAQRAQIESMIEANDIAGAQALIMAEVEKQVSGTAAAVATDADKMKVAFGELQETIGVALFPVVQEIAKTLTPAIQALQGPIGQIAATIGGALAQAFQAIAPILPPLATALAAIGQAVAGALATALQALIPALIPIAENLGSLATQIAPLLANVLGKVGEVFGRILGVVSPLLGPLTELVMGILNAAWPIVEVVADALLLLVDALTPVLDAVLALIQPLVQLIQTGLAVLLPIIKPILPVIEALANVLGQILVKSIGIMMLALGGLIKGLSTIAPFVFRNVAKPVVEHFLMMTKNVVKAAAALLGWVPGLGDAMRQAEAAITGFEQEAVAAISNAGDTIREEGGRIGDDLIAAGTSAMAQAAPALGTAAGQLGSHVAGQYNAAMVAGMRYQGMADAAGTKPPTPMPPPSPAPSPSGSPSGSDAASKQEEKRKAEIQKFIEGFERALERVKRGQDTLVASTKRAGAEFSEALGDMLPQSEVQDMFGPTGTIGGVISQYDQLDAAITDLYQPLTNAKRFGKQAADTARSLMADAKGFLRAATETAITLMKAKAANVKAIEKADSDYAAATAGINASFDALDKAAAANIASIEARFDAMIPGLEAALSAATEAFNRENGVLQDLIRERDGFLGQIRSGFRSFVNNLSFESAAASKQIIRETQTLANGITVTLEREIEVGGGTSSIKQQLQARLDAVREFSRNIRTLIQRGLDPTLVQDFVSAGVSGAGQAVAELANASSSDLAAINSIQAGLATEIASFQATASQQWFDAGIAQQEAIVAPLAAARDQAQAALNAANAARAAELTAARAHAEQLKVDRQIALDAAKAQYEAQKEALKAQGVEIDTALTANANNLHTQIANLQTTVPPEMFKAGARSVRRMLAGFREEFPGMYAKLNNMMDNLASSMNRTATVTITTVHRSVFEGARPDGARAMGGPVQAHKAYLVGERGPEMLVMGGRSGNVIPNHQLGSIPSMGPRVGSGGAGGSTINLNVNAGIGTDGAEVGRQLVEAIRKYERRSGPVFVSAS